MKGLLWRVLYAALVIQLQADSRKMLIALADLQARSAP